MGSGSSLHLEDVELIPQKEPVVALSPRFCLQEPLSLQQRSKFLQRSYLFVNAHTEGVRFVVKGQWSSCRKTLLDGSLSPVANYKGKSLSLKPIVYVRAGDDPASDELFQIYAKYHVRFKSEVRLEFHDLLSGQHCELGFEGHWRHRRGHIWLDRDRRGVREPVAKIHRPGGVSRRKFRVDIAPNMDTALVAMVCAILSKEQEREERHYGD